MNKEGKNLKRKKSGSGDRGKKKKKKMAVLLFNIEIRLYLFQLNSSLESIKYCLYQQNSPMLNSF